MNLFAAWLGSPQPAERPPSASVRGRGEASGSVLIVCLRPHNNVPFLFTSTDICWYAPRSYPHSLFAIKCSLLLFAFFLLSCSHIVLLHLLGPSTGRPVPVQCPLLLPRRSQARNSLMPAGPVELQHSNNNSIAQGQRWRTSPAKGGWVRRSSITGFLCCLGIVLGFSGLFQGLKMMLFISTGCRAHMCSVSGCYCHTDLFGCNFWVISCFRVTFLKTLVIQNNF